MSLSLVTGSAQAPLVVRGDDLYETPACAVRALSGGADQVAQPERL